MRKSGTSTSICEKQNTIEYRHKTDTAHGNYTKQGIHAALNEHS